MGTLDRQDINSQTQPQGRTETHEEGDWECLESSLAHSGPTSQNLKLTLKPARP